MRAAIAGASDNGLSRLWVLGSNQYPAGIGLGKRRCNAPPALCRAQQRRRRLIRHAAGMARRRAHNLRTGWLVLQRAVSNGATARPAPELPKMPRKLGRRFVIGIALLLLNAVHVGAVDAQPADAAPLAHFQWVKTITLEDPNGVHPDGLLMAGIRSLDVDADGRLAIVDLQGMQALLFSPDGTLLALLDPSACHPGFEVRPFSALFAGDQSIFLSNAGPWGYRFTADGQCLGGVDPDFRIASWGFLDADAEGNLIGNYVYPDKQVIRRMAPDGKTIREVPLPSSSSPQTTLRMRRGGLFVDEEHVFYAGPVEPHILKMTHSDSIVARISHRTSWFRDIQQDLPDVQRNPAALMQAVGRVVGSTTLTNSIFELTDDIFMVQYSDASRGKAYQIFAKDGSLVAEEYGVEPAFEHGKDGLVYRVIYPDTDDTGEASNPHLEVYQYVAQ